MASSSPRATLEIPEALPTSPAAMFLTSFTTVSPVTTLPDDEGEVCSGYTLGSIIGYGGSSIVRRAFSASGGLVAVKIVRCSDLAKTSGAAKRLEAESDVWKSLSHEHILPLFSSVSTSYAHFFFTLYCPAGSLLDILKRDGDPALPQDDAGMMFRQVVRGLRYMHEVVGMVHRDIKLENVLVDEMGVCRITDFGMTKKIGSEEDDHLDASDEENEENTNFHTMQRSASTYAHAQPPRRQVKAGLPVHLSLIRHRRKKSRSPAHVFQPGSLPYAAPELLTPNTSSMSTPIDPAQDIWALGIMLYALLTGRLPFSDAYEPRLQLKILHGVYDVPKGIGKGAERVLQGCLECTVSDRWTISMVDEWAWGIGWGAEGDEVVPAVEQRRARSSQSRSRSNVRTGWVDGMEMPSDEIQNHQELAARPSLDAARRRSSSRVERSLSRAPMLRSSSRSASRTPALSSSNSHTSWTHPVSAVPGSILRTASSSSSSTISTSVSSAFINSPSPSRERGRRLYKDASILTVMSTYSRSPSPSVAPATPLDVQDKPLVSSFSRLNVSKSRSPDTRGRQKVGGGRGARTPRPEFEPHVPGLDIVQESGLWDESTISLRDQFDGIREDRLRSQSPSSKASRFLEASGVSRIIRWAKEPHHDTSSRSSSVPSSNRTFAVKLSSTTPSGLMTPSRVFLDEVATRSKSVERAVRR